MCDDGRAVLRSGKRLQTHILVPKPKRKGRGKALEVIREEIEDIPSVEATTMEDADKDRQITDLNKEVTELKLSLSKQERESSKKFRGNYQQTSQDSKVKDDNAEQEPKTSTYLNSQAKEFSSNESFKSERELQCTYCNPKGHTYDQCTFMQT
jgi:hypothetical protein